MLTNIVTRFGVLFAVISMMLIAGLIFFSEAIFASSAASPMKASPTQVTTQVLTKEYPAASADAEHDAPIIKLASLSLDIGESSDKPLNDVTHIQEAAPSDTDSLLTRAMSFAQEQKFDEAIALLKSVTGADKEAYKVQFLEAKLLSWAGYHDQAEALFTALNKAYPQNSDIMVSHGYLKIYQKDYAQAETLFSDVLSQHPEYEDAKRGLRMARYAK